MERFRRFFRLDADDVDGMVEDELDMHLEFKQRDLREEGASAEDAADRARRAFGDPERVRRECLAIQRDIRRRRRWLERLGGVRRDLWLALRSLRRAPHFSGVIILTLGLGIGAATTAFTMMDALLVKALPFPRAQELGLAFERRPEEDLDRDFFSIPQYEAFGAEQESFDRTAVVSVRGETLRGDGPAERLSVAPVSASLFSMLGAVPSIGSLLADIDDRPEAPVRAVLTPGLWQRRFGGDPDIVGKTIELNGQRIPIVGVLAASYPRHGMRMWIGDIDVFVNLGALGPQWDWGIHTVLVRKRQGVTWAQAEGDLARFGDSETRRRGKNVQMTLVPLADEVGGEIRPAVAAMFGAAGILLLITCGNVTTLLLSRAPEREREMALRSTLGASRAHLVRGELAEHLLLAAFGMAVAVVALVVVQTALRSLAPEAGWIADRSLRGWRTTPWLNALTVDRRSLAFTAFVALVASFLFGLLPAAVASRTYPALLLRGRDRGAGVVRLVGGRVGIRDVLTAWQLAFTLVLSIGAGLLLQSYRNVLRTDLGFDPRGLVTAYVNPTGPAYSSDPAATAFYEEVIERVEAVPGVERVAVVDGLPLTGGVGWSRVAPEPASRSEGEPTPSLALRRHVSEGYFEVMRVDLRSGRFFDEGDRAGSRKVVVVDEGLARRLWPGQNPVGKVLGGGCPGGCPLGEVVGVVAPVLYEPLGAQEWIAAYDVVAQRGDGGHGVYVVARTEAEAGDLVPSVVAALRSVDPDQPVIDARPMEDRLSEAVLTRRLSAVIVTSFAVLALVLALVGLYGTIAHGVARSRRSIAIRMALGAPRGRVRAGVLTKTFALVGSGVALGVLASLGLTGFLESALHEVEPVDAKTFLLVSALLFVTAAAAAIGPAERAARVDPVRHFHTN